LSKQFLCVQIPRRRGTRPANYSRQEGGLHFAGAPSGFSSD